MERPADQIERRYRWSLVALLAAGLVIRLPFGPVDLGVSNDMRTFMSWARTIADGGLVTLAETSGQTLYPPLSLFMIGMAGVLESVVPQGIPGSMALLILGIKLPAILADVAIAAVLAVAVRDRGPKVSLLVAAAFLFNPAFWYLSAIWGQMDSVFSLFLLLAVVAVARGQKARSWLAYAASLASKLQSLALLPLLTLVTLRREGRRGLLVGIAVMAAVLTVLLIPWIAMGELGPYLVALGRSEEVLTRHAFNLWYLLWSGQVDQVPASVLVGPLPVSADVAGYVMLAAATVCVASAVWWRARAVGLAVPAAILLMAPFILATNMHERYLAPALVFVLLAAAGWERPRSLRHLWMAYAALSTTLFVNLISIARPIRIRHHPPPYDLFYTGVVSVSLVAAAVNVLVFAALLYMMFSDARKVTPVTNQVRPSGEQLSEGEGDVRRPLGKAAHVPGVPGLAVSHETRAGEPSIAQPTQLI